MMDIARQTVEFLYEETGSIPSDLHLPTLDEIKEDIVKFSIDRLRKGTVVVIKQEVSSAPASPPVGGASVGGATAAATADSAGLPKFAVPSMLKTFGLTGTVLDVDQVFIIAPFIMTIFYELAVKTGILVVFLFFFWFCVKKRPQ